MNLRKLKKIASPGNVYTIIGTHTAFMSLGGFKRTANGLSPIGINGIDLFARKAVTTMNGRCRPATKKRVGCLLEYLETNNKQSFTRR